MNIKKILNELQTLFIKYYKLISTLIINYLLMITTMLSRKNIRKRELESGIEWLKSLEFKTQKWYDDCADKIIELEAELEFLEPEY